MKHVKAQTKCVQEEQSVAGVNAKGSMELRPADTLPFSGPW